MGALVTTCTGEDAGRVRRCAKRAAAAWLHDARLVAVRLVRDDVAHELHPRRRDEHRAHLQSNTHTSALAASSAHVIPRARSKHAPRSRNPSCPSSRWRAPLRRAGGMAKRLSRRYRQRKPGTGVLQAPDAVVRVRACVVLGGAIVHITRKAHDVKVDGDVGVERQPRTHGPVRSQLHADSAKTTRSFGRRAPFQHPHGRAVQVIRGRAHGKAASVGRARPDVGIVRVRRAQDGHQPVGGEAREVRKAVACAAAESSAAS
jgi:hypothetical protein